MSSQSPGARICHEGQYLVVGMGGESIVVAETGAADLFLDGG
jgi:hypothetical protein